MLKLRKPLLPEWRYWPAIPFVILVLAVGFGFSLPVPASNLPITKEGSSVYCNNAETNQHANCAPQVPPIKAIVKSNSEDCEPEKPNKQTYDECLLTRYTGQLSHWTFTLFVATAVIGFLGLIGGILTYRQFRLSRDEFIINLRPWLTIEIENIALRAANGAIQVDLETRTTNIGKSPATNVSLAVKVVEGSEALNPDKIANDFFDVELMAARKRAGGYNALPGQYMRQPGIYGTDTNSPKIAKTKVSSVALILCASYSYFGGRHNAQTGCVFDLREIPKPAEFTPLERVIWDAFAKAYDHGSCGRVT